MGRDRKTPCRDTTPWKPCHDIKSSVAIGMSHLWENSVKTPSDHVATQTWPSPKPYRDIEFLSRHKAEKSLSLQRKPLSKPKPPNWPGNHVVTRRTLLRHRTQKYCRARCYAIVARASQPRAHGCCAHPGVSCAGLKTLSRSRTTVAT